MSREEHYGAQYGKCNGLPQVIDNPDAAGGIRKSQNVSRETFLFYYRVLLVLRRRVILNAFLPYFNHGRLPAEAGFEDARDLLGACRPACQLLPETQPRACMQGSMMR